jgi:hypothetical protein
MVSRPELHGENYSFEESLSILISYTQYNTVVTMCVALHTP